MPSPIRWLRPNKLLPAASFELDEPRLPADTYLRNLVGFRPISHTLFTYHRTWETGLRVAIRVTTFNPAFFARPSFPKPSIRLCNRLITEAPRPVLGKPDFIYNRNTRN